jgi:hypothetical protein
VRATGLFVEMRPCTPVDRPRLRFRKEISQINDFFNSIGQTRNNSVWANVVRVAPKAGHSTDRPVMSQKSGIRRDDLPFSSAEHLHRRNELPLARGLRRAPSSRQPINLVAFRRGPGSLLAQKYLSFAWPVMASTTPATKRADQQSRAHGIVSDMRKN